MRVYKFLSRKWGVTALRDRRLKLSDVNTVNDPFELFPFDLSDSSVHLAFVAQKDLHSNKNGLMCCSKEWSNPIMWAHYGENHTGVCLGFEVPEELCQEVRYIPEPLALPKELTQEVGVNMLFSKFEQWRYEAEIRMWAPISEREDGKAFINFSESMRLTSVIVGSACKDLSYAAVMREVGPYAGPVQYIKARRSFSEFKMVPESEEHLDFDRRQRDLLPLIKSGTLKPTKRPISQRNSRCACGSGKKYKRCCALKR